MSSHHPSSHPKIVTSNNHNLGPGCHPRSWPQHPLAAAAGRYLWQRNRAFQQHPACPGQASCPCETAGFSVERRVLKWHVEQEIYRPLHDRYKRTSEEPNFVSKKHLCLFFLPFWNRRTAPVKAPYIALYKPKKTRILPVWSTTLQPFLPPNISLNCHSQTPPRAVQSLIELPPMLPVPRTSHRWEFSPSYLDLIALEGGHRQESDGFFRCIKIWWFQRIIAYIIKQTRRKQLQ